MIPSQISTHTHPHRRLVMVGKDGVTSFSTCLPLTRSEHGY